jgi:hypothetical protein
MSAFINDTSLKIKDKEMLIEALKKMGIQECHIAVGEGIHLRGYRNDVRSNTADIVVKKEAFPNTASNDFGFKKNAKGQYSLLISEYDTTANAGFKTKLLQSYLGCVVKKQLSTQAGLGFSLKSTEVVNGKTVVTLSAKGLGIGI